MVKLLYRRRGFQYKKNKLVYDSLFELLNDQCGCVVWVVMHHRPFNVEIHNRAQPDVDVTAVHISGDVRKMRKDSYQNSK